MGLLLPSPFVTMARVGGYRLGASAKGKQVVVHFVAHIQRKY